MGTPAVTPAKLLPDIVTDLNIFIQWAEAAEDVSVVAEHGEQICRLYRAMAICLFVSDGNADDFFHWLLHSPLTHRFDLERLKAVGVGGSRFARASFIDPLMDAVAARQWTLATAIGDLESAAWMVGDEYEDDFCYGDLLRRLVREQDEGVQALLERWRKVLEGGQDRRLDIAEALVGREAMEFEGSLQALLAEHEAQARVMANPKSRSPLASELPFAPNRWVSVEGLALLAIAERRGMTITADLDGCPRMLREGIYSPFESRGYPNRPLG